MDDYSSHLGRKFSPQQITDFDAKTAGTTLIPPPLAWPPEYKERDKVGLVKFLL